MSSIVGVGLAAAPTVFHRLGFSLTNCGALGSLLRVSNMQLLLTDHHQGQKKTLLVQGNSELSIDGMHTRILPQELPTGDMKHDNGVVKAESLVIQTPDWLRTKSAFESIGIKEVKARDDIYPGLRLSFFIAGTPDNRLILELVGPQEPDPDVADTPAKLWGITWQVQDDLTLARGAILAPASLSPSRTAVQPGRQIATLKNEKGAGLAMAFITPPPPKSSL